MYEDTSASSDTNIEAHIIKNNKSAMNNLEANQANHVLFYLNQALLACKSLGNIQGRDRLLALTYNNLACYFQHINNCNKALEFLFKAVDLMSVEKDVTNLSAAHLNICSILSSQGQYERALRHSLKCIYILRNKDSHSLNLVKAFYAAGTQYKLLNQYNDAKDCFKKGYLISKSKLGRKHEFSYKLKQNLSELEKNEENKPRENHRKVPRRFTPIIHKKYRSPIQIKIIKNTSLERPLNFSKIVNENNKIELLNKLNNSSKREKLNSNLHRAQEKLAATTIQA